MNLNSVWKLCQLAGRHFLENDGGKIINIASMLSFLGGYTVAAYAASKGGVAQLTKALSNEWAGKNINTTPWRRLHGNGAQHRHHERSGAQQGGSGPDSGPPVGAAEDMKGAVISWPPGRRTI